MHKTRTIPGAAVLLVLGATLAGTSSLAADSSVFGDPRALSFPPLGEIRVPTPERMVLPNGLVVYLLEDHDFPVVDVRALMRVGSIYDPKDKIGLASVTGEVMRSGGTASMPGDSLDLKLESHGASVEISFENTDGSATVSTLSADQEEGIRVLADLLMHPAFPQEKIDLAKTQEKTQIASRNDEAMDIVFREFVKLVYGPDHPYARHTEYATIDAITRDDLVAFHREFVHPDRTILTVYGDFQIPRMKKLITSAFGGWERATTPLPPDPPVAGSPASGLYLADKGDMTNSIVVLGHIGMRMDDPDYPAMAVLTEIVGGGFSSRLINEIRTKRGLAYATGASAGAGYHHPDALLFYAVTQTDSTAATTRYVRREVERVLAEPVTQQELDRARDAILNSLVFTLSSKGAVLNRMARYDFYGYPKDFLQRFQEAVRKLTPEDLLAAARRKIHPDALATLVVGEREKIAPSLASLGEVKQIDISIPDDAPMTPAARAMAPRVGEAAAAGETADTEPGSLLAVADPPGEQQAAEPAPAPAPEATDAELALGQKILAAAVKAHGGPALTGMKDLTYDVEGSMMLGKNMSMHGRTVLRFPGCEYEDANVPMGHFVSAVCNGNGWRIDRDGPPQPMPPDAVEASKAGRRQDFLSILLYPDDYKLKGSSDTVDVNGHPAEVVQVLGEALDDWRLYFDAKTHLLVRMEFRARPSPGATSPLKREDYSDYREVDGIQWPFARDQFMDNAPFVSLKVTSVQVNSGVPDSLFQMPVK